MAHSPYPQLTNHNAAPKVIAAIICFLIGSLPVTMMTELRSGSANFWALLAFCLMACSFRSGSMIASLKSLRPYHMLTLALLIMPLTVAMASLWSHKLLEQDTERAVRVFLGTLAILAGCLIINPYWLKKSIWGFMAGVLGGTVSLISASWPHFNRPEMDQYTTVGYSNLLLLLSVLVLFSLGWQLSRFKRAEQLFKIAVVIIGLLGVIIAETRSSWIAMPFFIFIGLILIRQSIQFWQLIATGILAITIVTSAFFANHSLVARANLAFKEFVECRTKTPLADTSVCIRIQLWRASWHMFKANPLLANAGSAGFEGKLEELHKKGIVSEFTSKNFGEPHNDLFYALANYGLMGLLAFILMYSVPALMFVMKLNSRLPQETRVAAAMGLAVCVGFVAFGLTEAMFRSMRMLSFYSVLIAWLLTLSYSTNQINNSK